MHKRWTAKEDQMLLALHKQGQNFRFIARQIGRTCWSCNTRYLRLTGHYMPQASKNVGVHHFKIPENVLDARDRRANEHRSFSQVMFGDPPPSQSALRR